MCSQVPLFASLTPAQRSQLCTALKPMHVRGGTAIVRAGDVGDTFYVVEAGACSVVNEARQARPASSSPLQVIGFGFKFEGWLSYTIRHVQICCDGCLTSMQAGNEKFNADGSTYVAHINCSLLHA